MYPIMGGENANTWHDHMYIYCTLVATYIVVSEAHLQQFQISCHMWLQFNSSKNQTWLITYLCTMCRNYHIEDPFSIHLQL